MFPFSSLSEPSDHGTAATATTQRHFFTSFIPSEQHRNDIVYTQPLELDQINASAIQKRQKIHES